LVQRKENGLRELMDKLFVNDWYHENSAPEESAKELIQRENKEKKNNLYLVRDGTDPNMVTVDKKEANNEKFVLEICLVNTHFIQKIYLPDVGSVLNFIAHLTKIAEKSNDLDHKFAVCKKPQSYHSYQIKKQKSDFNKKSEEDKRKAKREKARTKQN